MKKSVVILIGIIYVASIFVVGFFGMRIKAFDTIIYITDIECSNENLKTKVDGTKELKFDYKIDGDKMENTLILTYDVYPKNSTLKGADAVKLVYDENPLLAEVDGLKITFLGRGVMTVYLKSLDGSNVIETIKIISY